MDDPFEIVILNEENIPEIMSRTGLSRMILFWRLHEDRRKGVKSAYVFTEGSK